MKDFTVAYGSLPCDGPIGGENRGCYACDQLYRKLEISEEAKTCAFNISGNPHLVFGNHGSGPLDNITPGTILSVQCGLGEKNTAASLAHRTNVDPVCPSGKDFTTVKFVATEYTGYFAKLPIGHKYKFGGPDRICGCTTLESAQCVRCDFRARGIFVGQDVTNCRFEYVVYVDGKPVYDSASVSIVPGRPGEFADGLLFRTNEQYSCFKLFREMSIQDRGNGRTLGHFTGLTGQSLGSSG